MSDGDHIKKLKNNTIRDLNIYFDLVNKLFSFLFGRKEDVLPLRIVDLSESSLEERIKKIDLARENMIESLAAIDELKVAAKQNKQELENALYKLSRLEEEKLAAEEELKEIKNIATSDIEIFQRLAGIPGKSDIFRERVIGFISGILSSLVVAGVIQLIIWIFK